jgi:hypothetical protein
MRTHPSKVQGKKENEPQVDPTQRKNKSKTINQNKNQIKTLCMQRGLMITK